jgi:hypothetical protein
VGTTDEDFIDEYRMKNKAGFLIQNWTLDVYPDK